VPRQPAHAPEAPPVAFADVTPAQWQSLAAKRVFFGHQSVGGNIMDGVAEVLAAHPGLGLHVTRSANLDAAAAPGIYHARIGQNGDPEGKAAAFTRIADAADPAIGLVTSCYVDVTGATDPDTLFADYQRRMADLRARHPGLVLVHVTMPLTSLGGRKERLMGWLRGTATTYDLNAIRNRYNGLLRAAYVGKEPVFDLARLESTHADGSRSFFTRGGDTIFYLAPELTDDGGHLNAEGRRRAAEEFLAVLATSD